MFHFLSCCCAGEVYLPSGFLHKPYVPVCCWWISDGSDVSYLLSSSSSCVSDWSPAFYRHFIINRRRVFRVSCGWNPEISHKDSFKTKGPSKRCPLFSMMLVARIFFNEIQVARRQVTSLHNVWKEAYTGLISCLRVSTEPVSCSISLLQKQVINVDSRLWVQRNGCPCFIPSFLVSGIFVFNSPCCRVGLLITICIYVRSNCRILETWLLNSSFRSVSYVNTMLSLSRRLFQSI